MEYDHGDDKRNYNETKDIRRKVKFDFSFYLPYVKCDQKPFTSTRAVLLQLIGLGTILNKLDFVRGLEYIFLIQIRPDRSVSVELRRFSYD